MVAIIRKELLDYVTSVRGLIIFFMVFGISAIAIQAAQDGITGVAAQSGYNFIKLFTTSAETLPQVMNFHSIMGLFFIPIVGIALGFDAVNSERTSGTLSRILSQPIYRDEVINAKVLVRVFILASLMGVTLLIIAGIGMPAVGVTPHMEEIARLGYYFVLAVIYGAFWLGLAVLFSVLFRSIGTSLLVSLFLWLFFSLFPVVASFSDSTTGLLQGMAAWISPSQMFLNASANLLQPLVTTLGYIDPTTAYYTTYMIFSPPSLDTGIMLAAVDSAKLVGWTAIALATSYVLFMRQEVRYG